MAGTGGSAHYEPLRDLYAGHHEGPGVGPGGGFAAALAAARLAAAAAAGGSSGGGGAGSAAGGAVQSTAYQLSGHDLKELYRPRGCMPRISFAQPTHPRADATQRIAFLEHELEERVQRLCDRLCGVGEDAEHAVARCWSACWEVLGKYVKLGIIGEILPQIFFYVAYSLAVTYYAQENDWDIRWTAAKQDVVYYPAVVLTFLLCFRASGCMERYNDGLRTVFLMEKCLREIAFEVCTRLRVEGDEDDIASLGPEATGPEDQHEEFRALRKRYFKHEFRRMLRLLFACAARDLNDSALQDAELNEDEAMAIQCAMTKAEHSAVLVTHSAYGHAFRVYLAASWLLKLVRGIDEERLFDGNPLEVSNIVEEKLSKFKHSWLEARQVAYSSMPDSVTHVLWMLCGVMSLFMPWEWVSVCRWSTWFPSVLLTISFYGILQIASSMENPFGFDTDDIPIAKVAEHLDEEVCLTMQYAMLDEFGGENLYRNLMGSSMVFLDEAGLPGSEGLAFLANPMHDSPRASRQALLHAEV